MRQQITKRITPAAVAPVTVADAKLDLRVDHAADDALIESLIAAATDYLESPNGAISKAFITQTWTHTVPLPERDFRIYLPITPVQSIASISYYDPDNVEQTLTVSDFYFHGDEDWAYIEPKQGTKWPSVFDRLDAITVEFVAGFGDAADDVPQTIRQCIRLLVAHWYTHRAAVVTGASVSELPMAVESLISMNRKGWVY